MVRLPLPKTYKSKKRAWNALQKLKEKLNYDSIKTLQDEGCYPERVKIIKELYVKDGRESEDHPFHSMYSGLAEKYLNNKDGLDFYQLFLPITAL